MGLLTEKQKEKMIANGKQTAIDHDGSNHWPVVKLFTPDSNATWLLTELDPEEPDIAFGLCDLGFGFPELGYVRMSEIESICGQFGLPVEREVHFKPEKNIMEYAADARSVGYIVG